MDKKILLLGLLCLLYLPIVSAQEVYSLGQNISIERSCFNSNQSDGECSASTLCRITVFKANSDSQVLILNANMTNNKPVHNFTINQSVLDTLGLYRYDIVCVDGSISDFNSFSFLLTPSGAEPVSSGQGTLLLGVMAIILFIAIVFLVLGFNAQHVVLKTLGFSFGAIMILVLVLFTLLVLNEVVASSPVLVSGFETFYFVVKTLGTVGIVALIILLLLVFVKAWKIRRGLIDK